MTTLIKPMVNKLLTGVSQMLKPIGFVADMAFPEIVVKQTAGLIGKYGMAHLRLVNTVMGGKGKAPTVEAVIRSSDTYLIEKHGLTDMVTEEDYDNVEEPFSAESDVVEALTTLLKVGKEKALADALTNASIITQTVTLAGGDQWSSYAASEPGEDIATGKAVVHAACGVRPNAAIIPGNVVEVLRYHPKLLRSLGFADERAGTLSNDDIKKALNLEFLYVADAVYNTAKEGQADSLAAIWGKDVVLYVRPAKAAKYQVSLGYNIVQAKNQYQVYKHPVSNPPNANEIIVINSYDQVLTNVKAAYLIKAAIA